MLWCDGLFTRDKGLVDVAIGYATTERAQEAALEGARFSSLASLRSFHPGGRSPPDPLTKRRTHLSANNRAAPIGSRCKGPEAAILSHHVSDSRSKHRGHASPRKSRQPIEFVAGGKAQYLAEKRISVVELDWSSSTTAIKSGSLQTAAGAGGSRRLFPKIRRCKP